MAKQSFWVLATLLIVGGCASPAEPSGVDSTSVQPTDSETSEQTPAEFNSDVLFDGVSLIDSEYENRFGFEPMGVPQRSTSTYLNSEFVAPERCVDIASFIFSYAQPDSTEAGYFQASFIEGIWGYIGGFRTTPEYRERLAASLDSCTEFSSLWEADTIYNGELRYEKSEYKITRIHASEPDRIVVSLDAVISRQFEDAFEPGDCLQYFGPSCIDTFGAKYRFHIVSLGEYSLSFMIENWDGSGPDLLDPPVSLGVSETDLNEIDQRAKQFLEGMP
jgi:hypothetical protein